jgi:uncharacterized Zn-binding protein involved in type VI secretion
MGQPAARQGDTTVHGGTIVQGEPSVLIEGQPAARQGDMHVCPACSGTVPHAGGPITHGVPTILINGQPAARQADLCTCNGPPDAIAAGASSVRLKSGGNPVQIGGGDGVTKIGGSGPVVIGGGGPEGADGSAGGEAAVRGAVASAAMAGSEGAEPVERSEHWIEFAFRDAAGYPVQGNPYRFDPPDGEPEEGWLNGDGRVRRDAVSDGEGAATVRGVHAARWGRDVVEPGASVAVTATTCGYDDGTPAAVRILEVRVRGADVVVDDIDTEVTGNEIEAEWRYERPPSPALTSVSDGAHRAPVASPLEFRAEVRVEGHPVPAHAGRLAVRDVLEGTVTDLEDDPRPGDAYRLTRDDALRTGSVDRSGTFEEREVAPGSHWCS